MILVSLILKRDQFAMFLREQSPHAETMSRVSADNQRHPETQTS